VAPSGGGRTGARGYPWPVRALVTGGHGFVGSHVVELLLARGRRVRCLHRREGTPAVLRDLEVEIASGDVRDSVALAAALDGVDEVYHLAALTRSRTRREMLETNVEGTRRLLAAARDARLPGRFLFCSSLAAAGPAREGRPLVEADPCRPITWYGESKWLGEEAVRGAASDLAVTIVRPPAVYGPRDRDFLAVFQAAARGFLPVLGTGRSRLHFVYVADLAEAIVQAAEAAATHGRTYFATHEEILTTEAFGRHVADAVGRTVRTIRVPRTTLALVARLGELAGQVTGRAPLLNGQRLKDLEAPAWLCSAAALRRDTAWRPGVGVADGTRRTALWYREHGQLGRAR